MIVSIETSTTVCSVALHGETGLLASGELHTQKSHSKKLTLMVKSILEHADVPMRDLAAVAVSAGPGSYTGLRIGVSVAKSMSFALEIPLIAVSTLEAMAAEWAERENAKQKTIICPMLDARRMEVYAAYYTEKMECLKPATPTIIDENTFAKVDSGKKLVLMGNGASKCEGFVNHPNYQVAGEVYPKAMWVGYLAMEKFRNKDFESLAYFEPEYLKPYQAKVSKKKGI